MLATTECTATQTTDDPITSTMQAGASKSFLIGSNIAVLAPGETASVSDNIAIYSTNDLSAYTIYHVIPKRDPL